MFGPLGDLLSRLKPGAALKKDSASANPEAAETVQGQNEMQPESENPAGPGAEGATPEGQSSAPVMFEILKLLARIEYGIDEQQIAEALVVSSAEALANCQALEQEMFVHHHDAEWFIGQRGLEFLRLHGEQV